MLKCYLNIIFIELIDYEQPGFTIRDNSGEFYIVLGVGGFWSFQQ